MAKNKKVMSMAIRPDLHDEVKKLAKRKGLSLSTFVGDLVEQVLKIDPDDEPKVVGKPIDQDIKVVYVPQDEDVKVIVLKIPLSLRSNPEKMAQWMDTQAAGIVKAMTKNSTPEADNSITGK